MRPDRASSTARVIAAATVMRERQGDGDCRPPDGAADWCAVFLSACLGDRLLLWSTSFALGRCWWRFVEWVTIPGIVRHWMVRKREIDRIVCSAAEGGYSQLVVIGAGLDSLACRMSCSGRFRRIISADHPATLAVVQSALSRAESADRLPLPPRQTDVSWVELDLENNDATATLMSSGAFETTRSTVIVMEGVLMYLFPERVGEIFESLARMPVPAARLVATWMVAEPGYPTGFRGQSRVVGAWLNRQREPMHWEIRREALSEFLSRHGWSIRTMLDLALPGPNEPIRVSGLPSEQIFIAEKNTENGSVG